MRNLPYATAGLQRRRAPRNDNGGDGNGRGVSLRLDCHVAVLLAMTKRKVEWFREDPLGCLETIDVGLSLFKAYSLIEGVGGFSGGSGSQVDGMGAMLAGHLNGVLG